MFDCVNVPDPLILRVLEVEGNGCDCFIGEYPLAALCLEPSPDTFVIDWRLTAIVCGAEFFFLFRCDELTGTYILTTIATGTGAPGPFANFTLISCKPFHAIATGTIGPISAGACNASPFALGTLLEIVEAP